MSSSAATAPIEAIPSSGEIAVCGMDYDRKLLKGVDGSVFFEAFPNLWFRFGENPVKRAYLGTGRHGGGIVLRIMYEKREEHWINASTGRDAPRDIQQKLDLGL